MSTAVLNSPMFDCSDLLLRSAVVQKKESAALLSQNNAAHNVNMANHAPLRRTCTSLISLYEQHRKLDRSASEPASRYKTELCRPFEESGVCKYADKCQFAHGYGELRNLQRHPKYKTVMCRTYHSIGFCPYGPRCHFLHNYEEARIHNQKLNAQQNLLALNPLLMNNNAAAAAAVANSGLNLSLLEQLASHTVTLQLAQMAQNNAAAVAAQKQQVYDDSVVYPDNLASKFNSRPLLTRANSLGLTGQSNVVGATRPKPLTLSPTFSLGSTADSISPSSSLSQSPTNSMASFFSDEPASVATTTPFSFGQEFSLMGSRQSPSPQGVMVGGGIAIDEMAPRTPSPLSPSAESRLPVFNRISSTVSDFENLRI